MLERNKLHLTLQFAGEKNVLPPTLSIGLACSTLAAGLIATFSSPAQAQERIGPSFSCSAAGNQPLAQIICYSNELSRLDLAYVIAYQAVLNGESGLGRKALADEAAAFVRAATEQCRIPNTGFLGRAPTAQEVACVKDRYEQQRILLARRATGQAAEEASLQPEEAIAVQRALQRNGYLPQAATIDGVFGPATRTAITAWRQSQGLPGNGGIVSRETLSRLTSATPAPSPRGNSRVADSLPGNFGPCSGIGELWQYTPDHFASGSVLVLGMPSSTWTLNTLAEVQAWGSQCIERARQSSRSGSNVADRMESEFRQFSRDARSGIERRLANQAEAADQRRASERRMNGMNAQTTLPNGASVTCQALADLTVFEAIKLDDFVFGRRFRDFKLDDFKVLNEKALECAPYLRVRNIGDLAYHQERSLAAERQDQELAQRLATTREANRRADAIGVEEQRRLGQMGEQVIVNVLAGRPIRDREQSLSDRVLYCGGYFSTDEVRNALTKADIFPSADTALLTAVLGVTGPAKVWLEANVPVLGEDTVRSRLVPVFNAGSDAGRSTTPQLTVKMYSVCKKAVEELAEGQASKRGR